MAELNENYEDMAPPENDFTPVPDGWYPAYIFQSDKRFSSAGNAMLEVGWKITGPKYANRTVFKLFMLDHPSEDVVRISREQRYSLFYKALGIIHMKNTNEAHNKPHRIKLATEPAKGDFPAKNKVVAFEKARDGGTTLPKPKPINDDALPF